MADKEDVEEGEEERGPAKEPMPKLVKRILVVSLGLLGSLLIFFGSQFFLFSSGEQGPGGPEEAVEEELPAVDILWLEIKRIPASLTDANGRYLGTVFFDFKLELRTTEDQSYVSQQMPRIQHEFLKAVSVQGIGKKDAPTMIDYDRVAEMLKVAANNALGRDLVHSVVIPRGLRAS
ncbi:MAG: hypothetical protein V3R73_04785 [Sphingomonadales bacterium]